MRRFAAMPLLAFFLASMGSGVYAAEEKKMNDAWNASMTNVSLVEAIGFAEQHANGKAVKADYEESKTGLVYEIEVVSGERVMDVVVNADTGAIISSEEDKIDHDDEDDD